ncbi:Structural maintenance of chromosomes protein 5, partial [Nowakowskiella sp. JEL0078]
LRQNGFEAIGIDLIQAPELVMCFLCQYANIHRKPVALKEVDVTKLDNQLFGDFIVGNTHYIVRKAYGAVSTRATSLSQPRYLIASVDANARHEIEIGLRENKVKMEDIECHLNQAKSVHNIKDSELKALKDEKVQFENFKPYKLTTNSDSIIIPKTRFD